MIIDIVQNTNGDKVKKEEPKFYIETVWLEYESTLINKDKEYGDELVPDSVDNREIKHINIKENKFPFPVRITFETEDDVIDYIKINDKEGYEKGLYSY